MQQGIPKIKPLSHRTEAEKERAKKQDIQSHQLLRELCKLPGNTECADCTAKFPGWSALPHGVFLCITCAQIHRHIGRHVSQVKAISTGTYLWFPDEIKAMEIMGNDRANAIYLANAPKNITSVSSVSRANGYRKPSKDDSQHTKEQYVRNKYEHKKWFALPTGTSPNTGNVSRPATQGKAEIKPGSAANAKTNDDIWDFFVSAPATPAATLTPTQPTEQAPAQTRQQSPRLLGQSKEAEAKAKIMAMYDFSPSPAAFVAPSPNPNIYTTPTPSMPVNYCTPTAPTPTPIYTTAMPSAYPHYTYPVPGTLTPAIGTPAPMQVGKNSADWFFNGF